MSVRSFSCQAIVIKRTSVGETDRIVTLLSQEMGKFAAVAKGVRKLSSSRGPTLEPGNYVKVHCVTTKSLPILTQTALLSDTWSVRDNLASMKQLHQLLEIYDRLFVESELETELFEHLLATRALVLSRKAPLKAVRDNLEELIIALGFQEPKTAGFDSLSDYIAALTDRKVHSFEYLTPKNS